MISPLEKGFIHKFVSVELKNTHQCCRMGSFGSTQALGIRLAEGVVSQRGN